eukprot:TRINITY_DN1266_c0_g1_i2.p1 TRINITY_DN1266_c0_g1~~TRINITY_DN1266_c0_g1_i2.p1  ORF type:complete len:907 (-),score=328.67 TRINITY_DN1266_c0_g1_i2:612-3332(-)
MEDENNVSVSEMSEVLVTSPPPEIIAENDEDRPPPVDPEESFVANASLDIPRLYQETKQREQLKINKKHKKKDRKSKRKSGKGKDAKEDILLTEHTWDIKELAGKFETDINFEETKASLGLSVEEAQKRLERDGPNVLTPAKVTPMWIKFLQQFIQFFPLLLEAGGILCIIAYILDDSTADNLYLGIILWLVVIITAVFSFMQEAKSASVMDGFKKLAPQNCKVHRGGKTFEINAIELVLGDVVSIKAGDKIPADLRLIWVNNLKVDNSSLTGESEPQSRGTDCTDENPLETKNLAFYGTLANEGEAVGVVVRCGDNTVIGKIANLATSTGGDETPLHKEISFFIKIVSAVAISLGVIFFIIGIVVKIDWVPNVVFVIGIIVANVPEGLLPTVTVGLTLTAKRLARKNVLVKNLEAVETLGSTTTIASDKTGTLTQNRMTVVHLYYDNKIWDADNISTEGQVNLESPSFKALHRIAAICNRAVFDSKPENMVKEVLQRQTVGDASESALLKFCEPIRNVESHRAANPKLFEVPFNSVNKWQLSIHQTEEDGTLLVMKGAPERVFSRCKKILIDGNVVDLTDKHEEAFQHAYEVLAGHGERVLGFAHLDLDPSVYNSKTTFDVDKQNYPIDNLVFVGLVALMDPPRPNVPDAVAKCKQAGVRVIMVTGDHPLTAQAIARQVGILEGDTVEDIAKREDIEVSKVDKNRAVAIVVKGSELDSLAESDWDYILSKRQIVFARTSPEQKLMIVEQCQKRGEIVAVTGDGVNDSPALKKADLGCAMGITGSDVSKEAADIILLDDNFASIVNGIEEGRIIFDNLKKSIAYTLSSNSAELAPFVLFVLAQMPLALSAVLILCIDLGTDMIPAISLAYPLHLNLYFLTITVLPQNAFNQCTCGFLRTMCRPYFL